MKLNKKIQVHLLPTEDASHIAFIHHLNTFKFTPDLEVSKSKRVTNQHLYFTSDEKPDVGEYYIHTFRSNTGTHQTVNTCHTKLRQTDLKWLVDGNSASECRKIISSTDTKLKLGTCEDCKQDKDYRHFFIKCTCSLHQPPQSFIEEFCKAGGIWKVLVEYTDWCDYDDDNDIGLDSPDLRLKVNSQNEITIHSVKDSWTKEEVIYLAKCMALSTLGSKDSKDIFIACDKWIEENL